MKISSLSFGWKTVVGKLDGVAPLITDPPPTSYTNLSEKKERKKWKNVTCDM